MGLYFGETEITKIRDLVPQPGLDITDLWFGETNIYTVWQTYEGTLPATFNANGDNMKQYQVYGATGGVGDRTVQLFDMSTMIVGEGLDFNGQIVQSSISNRSDFIKILPNTSYVRNYNVNDGVSRIVQFYNAEKTYIDETRNTSTNPLLVFTTPNNAEYLLIAFSKNSTQVSLTEGTTPPETYVPFGYEVDMSVEKPIIYGFHINKNDQNPYTAVTYLEDAVGKTPAAMGSTTFSYGDWENAFFMPRPCMLKYDGTVDYYLNPNDYSQKADGTPSDYNSLAYGGNAMMEFPLIWYKFVQGEESGEGYFYCSNRKVDDTYKCFSNMDCDGNIIDHFYMPIYNGCTYDGKMRSISGLQLSPWSTTAYSDSSTYAVDDKVNYQGKMWKCITAVETAESFDPEKWEQFAFNGNTSGTEEIAQATANNTTEKVEWYIDQWCDRALINGLLVLMGKSLDIQGAFGQGISAGSGEAKSTYITGVLDNRGMFYGSTSAETVAVKVFGMENWWALEFRSTAGLIGVGNDTYLYKLTASTADGSTVNAYNTDGSGYLSVGNKPASSNYIRQMKFGVWGWLPFAVGSYPTQYYKDYFYNGTGFSFFGGSSNHARGSGPFCIAFFSVNTRAGYLGAALSCKPCRTGNLSKNIENATVTPIYIGDTALQKDEYIDYKEQKVYRMSGGVLTPTDPPVALPALPTCEGTTIVDYVGESVAVPEKVLLKYRKEGY